MASLKEPLFFLLLVSFCLFGEGAQSPDDYFMGTAVECGGGSRTVSEINGNLMTKADGATAYLPGCSWTFTIDSLKPMYALQLNFKEFDFGEGDTLTLSDTQFGGSVLRLTYDSQTPPQLLTELTGFAHKLTLEFVSNSDNSTGSGAEMLWYAQVSDDYVSTPQPFQLPRSTVYRDVLANADYTLTSPNYPSNYPNDKTLYWALSASAGERIQLSFNFFRLSLDDTLSIHDGLSDDESSLLVRYSGYKKDDISPVISHSSEVFIIFISSDNGVTDKGFSITYHVYVYVPPSTTEEQAKKRRPLTSSEKAVIAVICVLLGIMGIILATYFLHFKPKQKAEERKIASEFFESQENLSGEHVPQRPLTVSEAAKLQAERLMADNPKLNYGTQRPQTAGRSKAELVGSGRPRPRPGTASQRPGTALQRPGTASQRPGTASQRPGTTPQRPGTALQRPGTASQRPRTASQRQGAASQHPGIVSMQSGSVALKATSAFQNVDSPIEIHATGQQNNLYDEILGESKSVQLGVIQSSGEYGTREGLSLPSYEKTTRPLGRLAPLSTNQSELPMDDDGTERKTKVKKKKRKLKEPKAIDETDFNSSTNPPSGLHASATAPGSLADDLEAVLKLPGLVIEHEDESYLNSSRSSANMRPMSSRPMSSRLRHSEDNKAVDLSDGELSL